MRLKLLHTFISGNTDVEHLLYEMEDVPDGLTQWIGFLAPKGDVVKSEISLKQSFDGKDFQCDFCSNNSGASYFIAAQVPQNLDAFVEDAVAYAQYLNKRDLHPYRYFHWLRSFSFDPAELTSLAFSTGYENETFYAGVPTSTTVYAPGVRQPILNIQPQLNMTFDEVGSRFEFRPALKSATQIIQLPGPTGQGLWGAANSFFIDFGHPKFLGSINAEISTVNDAKGIEQGLKFTGVKNGYYYSKHYNILGARQGSAPLNLWLDPGQIFDHNRTQITYLETISFKSQLTLNTGKPIELKALPKEGGYAWALQKSWMKDWEKDVQADSVYLTPFGSYQIVEDFIKNGEQGFLMPGVTGTEMLSFENGDILQFHPNQPGFIPTFPLSLGSGTSPSEELLSDEFTTSWVTVKKGAGNSKINYYFSQPAETPLFEPMPNLNEILRSSHVPSAPLLYDEEEFAFPLVPSALAQPDGKSKGRREHFTAEELVLLELQIFGPARKVSINSIREAVERDEEFATKPVETGTPQHSGNAGVAKVAPTTVVNEKITTTPQGFLVTVDENSISKKWTSLQLANNTKSGSSGLGAEVDVLEFKNVIPELQSAFQSPDLFMVISNPQLGLQKYFEDYFDNKIKVAGWPFFLDILGKETTSNVDTAFKNILIFKFGNGSMVERIKNKSLWTSPDQFNDSSRIPALQQWILQYIDSSRKEVADGASSASEAAQDEGISNFLKAVDDPNWNGILALKVTLGLQELPNSIRAITSGIDLKRFSAHHFGIQVNKIQITDGKLKKEVDSSLFGLVSYYNETYKALIDGDLEPADLLPPVNGDYGFDVLNLQVLLKNSALVNFNCKIQLSFNQFFDDPVIGESLAHPEAINRNSLLLRGQYEVQNGNSIYRFYPLGHNNLTIDSSALESVGISDVNFTLVDNNPNDTLLTTRFSLSGALKFKRIGDFDLFTYNGLRFRNFLLDLNFDSEDPGKRSFAPKPEALVFDNDGSKTSIYTTELREHSFARHFPMQIEGLISDHSFGGAPKTVGYLAVDAPIETQPIKEKWYALKYKINMGSMGALAEKANFNAYLLAAWSPVSNLKTGQIHIKIPFTGGGGSKGFSLQGVLKLAVGSVRFEKKENTGEYALLLTHLGVKLLGLKLPPTGNTILYLFGDPDANSENSTSSLGWFGAYNKETE